MNICARSLSQFTCIFILLIGVGCSSTNIRIQTNPEQVQVYAKPVGSGELRHLGSTPLQMNNQEMQKEFSGSGAVYIELRKSGFKVDSFFITEISKVDLTINRQMTPIKNFEQQQWLNSHIEKMFEVRRLVNSKRYNEALRLIRNLKERSPYVASIHEMEAGILLLKGHYKDSLDSYRKARQYNPESVEATKMVKYLEKTLDVPSQVEFYDQPNSLRIPATESKGGRK